MTSPSNYNLCPQAIQTGYLIMESGETLSPVFDCGTLNPVALIFPTNTDTQTFGIFDNTAPFTGYAAEYSAAVADATGTVVAFQAAANRKVSLDTSIALSINRFQLYSATPQSQDIQITVVMAPLVQGTF